MFVIRAILLSAVSPLQEFSYFYKDAIEEGSVIALPVKNSEGFGLVTRCTPLAEEKQTLRASSFELRKLSNPRPKLLYRRAFLRAAFTAAMFEACSPGALIAALTPTAVFKKRDSIPAAAADEDSTLLSYEPLLLTQSRSERSQEYRRLSREALARGKSMLIICPTIAETIRLGEELAAGVKDYVEIFHGDLTDKKSAETWVRAVEAKQPRIIVGTLMALSVPRTDIATVLLERENARSYDTSRRPFISGARVTEAYAKAIGARFILASTAASVNSFERKQKGEVGDLGLSAIHLAGPAPYIIDAREEKKERGKFEPLSQHTRNEIARLLAEKKQVLVVAARKGLAPLTVCDDCGTTLACPVCNRSLVLHGGDNRSFQCHNCGEQVAASVRCGKCGGWRLTTLGISSGNVAESLTRHFPNETILTATGDTGARENIGKVVSKWVDSKGASLLIGTEAVLPFLPDQISGVIVASVDSFLGIPEYSAGERACLLLAELRSRSEEIFIIQSRNPEHRVMRAVREGMLGTWYKEELRDREKYKYPPFVTLVRLSISGKEEFVKKESEKYAKALEQVSPILIDGGILRRGIVQSHLLLRLPQGKWIDGRLLQFLRALPPYIEVRIDPKQIMSS